MSICYFNNQTMMALNKRGQNEDSFLTVNEQLLTNCRTVHKWNLHK